MQPHPDIVGWMIGAAGLLIGIFGIVDARRQRSKVEQMLQLERGTIHELNGFLIGLKPSLSPPHVQLVNERLQLIKERNEQFERVASGK